MLKQSNIITLNNLQIHKLFQTKPNLKQETTTTRIYGKVKTLLDERSQIEENDHEWDELRSQVHEFLIKLKESRREKVQANKDALRSRFSDLLSHMDLTDLRRNHVATKI